METTRWGDVSYKIEPDDDGGIVLVLDGSEYTMEFVLEPIVALRLGQGLVKCARVAGLPANTVDA